MKSNTTAVYAPPPSVAEREIGNLLPNNQRQRRTSYAVCHILYPVSAALTSFFRMDSISTSFAEREQARVLRAGILASPWRRSRANLALMRQSRPDSDLGLGHCPANVFKIF